jgi:very-short-patch-repair endonuclease/prophage antirepressor-like protein
MENQEFELVFISDSDTDNASDIMSDKKELANYSYISNGLYFEYFVGYEIAALLGYKNPKDVISKNISKCNRLEFRDYPGVKEPELDPRTILITRDGAIEILIKTRKRISPDILHILKNFGIETTNRKCLTKEQQTLSALTNSFKTEKFEDQFKVGRYYLDLYFPEYKIVVECDENGHADRKPYKERERMDFVNEKLGLTDDNWIRYNPDAEDFDISKVIGKIYTRINLLKSVQIETLLQNHQTTSLPAPSSSLPSPEPEEDWKINIEVKTGKFLPPPREDLIKKFEKYRTISELKRRYKISAKPIEKWCRDYEINPKDYDITLAPEKDVLIDACSKYESRGETAEHFGVSVHIFGKWCEKYEIEFYDICKKAMKVNKEELFKMKSSELTESEISEQLNIPILKVEKALKANSIEIIPSKEDLEALLQIKTKEDIAIHYNTCRTTLRHWIKFRGLQDIRCKVKTNRPITVIDKDNITTVYGSVSDLCAKLHMTPSTIRKFVNTNTKYNGMLFTEEEKDENESEEPEEIKVVKPEPPRIIEEPNFTIYSHENTNYFRGKDVADFIGVKDSSQCIRLLVSEENKIQFQNFKGLQSPKLKPNTILITKDGIKEILSKSRKVDPLIVDKISLLF